jgi:hypothetical protein
MGDSQERETSILGGGANPWNLINCPVLGFSVCLLITTINRKQGAPGLNNTFVRKRRVGLNVSFIKPGHKEFFSKMHQFFDAHSQIYLLQDLPARIREKRRTW